MDGTLRVPADCKAWKHVEEQWPEFDKEPRHLRLGLATGPALFAWEEHEAMGPLIRRKFEQEGDVELVSSFN